MKLYFYDHKRSKLSTVETSDINKYMATFSDTEFYVDSDSINRNLVNVPATCTFIEVFNAANSPADMENLVRFINGLPGHVKQLKFTNQPVDLGVLLPRLNERSSPLTIKFARQVELPNANLVIPENIVPEVEWLVCGGASGLSYPQAMTFLNSGLSINEIRFHSNNGGISLLRDDAISRDDKIRLFKSIPKSIKRIHFNCKDHLEPLLHASTGDLLDKIVDAFPPQVSLSLDFRNCETAIILLLLKRFGDRVSAVKFNGKSQNIPFLLLPSNIDVADLSEVSFTELRSDLGMPSSIAKVMLSEQGYEELKHLNQLPQNFIQIKFPEYSNEHNWWNRQANFFPWLQNLSANVSEVILPRSFGLLKDIFKKLPRLQFKLIDRHLVLKPGLLLGNQIRQELYRQGTSKDWESTVNEVMEYLDPDHAIEKMDSDSAVNLKLENIARILQQLESNASQDQKIIILPIKAIYEEAKSLKVIIGDFSARFQWQSDELDVLLKQLSLVLNLANEPNDQAAITALKANIADHPYDHSCLWKKFQARLDQLVVIAAERLKLANIPNMKAAASYQDDVRSKIEKLSNAIRHLKSQNGETHFLICVKYVIECAQGLSFETPYSPNYGTYDLSEPLQLILDIIKNPFELEAVVKLRAHLEDKLPHQSHRPLQRFMESVHWCAYYVMISILQTQSILGDLPHQTKNMLYKLRKQDEMVLKGDSLIVEKLKGILLVEKVIGKVYRSEHLQLLQLICEVMQKQDDLGAISRLKSFESKIKQIHYALLIPCTEFTAVAMVNARFNQLEKAAEDLKNSAMKSDDGVINTSAHSIARAVSPILREARQLTRKISENSTALENLSHSLELAFNVVQSPNDQKAIAELKKNAEKNVYGRSRLWKKLLGALSALAGAAIIALSIAGIPFTAGLSMIGMTVGGSLLSVSGAALFYAGRQKGLAKGLNQLAEVASSEAKKKPAIAVSPAIPINIESTLAAAHKKMPSVSEPPSETVQPSLPTHPEKVMSSPSALFNKAAVVTDALSEEVKAEISKTLQSLPVATSAA